MNIIPKFDIGQEVFFMEDNKVVSKTVERIVYTATNTNDGFTRPLDIMEVKTYGFRKFTLRGAFDRWEEKMEDDLFATKEELLASL